MSLSINQIVTLFETRGSTQYGAEAVSQIEHALQCAMLAERAEADGTLVTASLLHDLGHLLHSLGDDPAAGGVDDVHQFIALPFLRSVFPESVLGPIRLHVDAKRYLCAVEPGYWEALSPASKRSLELQGGIYSPAEAQSFMDQAFAEDAVNLRRWDDRAKTPGLPTPPLSHFATVMRASQLSLEPIG
jgi:phosphonate degradation associated HDIG domain protein